jgi:hypothetical protein
MGRVGGSSRSSSTRSVLRIEMTTDQTVRLASVFGGEVGVADRRQ